MSEQDTPTPQAAPEPVVDTPRTFTQDDLNRHIADRLARQKAQYADYDDLKAKAEQFDALKAEQMTELERERTAREAAEKAAAEAAEKVRATERAQTANTVALKVAKELGVPSDVALEFAGRLVGDDAEAIESDARNVFAKLPKVAPAAPPAADDSANPSTSDDEKALASIRKAAGLT